MRIYRFFAWAAALAAFAPAGSMAAAPIRIGFPIPLSGATALYGVPVLKGAELAVQQINANLKAFTHQKIPSSLSIQGYIAIEALADGIKKAHSTNSDKVAKALLGMTFDTPIGPRTFTVSSHETLSPEFWGVMVKEAAYPIAVMKDPRLLPTRAQLDAAVGENPFAVTAKNMD